MKQTLFFNALQESENEYKSFDSNLDNASESLDKNTGDLIVKLESSDIDGRIALLRDTKNGDDRRVPLSKKALALIEYLPNGLPIDISSSYCTCEFIKYRPPELKHIHFHDTRHEALTRMAKKIPNPMDWVFLSFRLTSNSQNWSDTRKNEACERSWTFPVR